MTTVKSGIKRRGRRVVTPPQVTTVTLYILFLPGTERREEKKTTNKKTLGSIVREVNIIDPDPPLSFPLAPSPFFFAKNKI